MNKGVFVGLFSFGGAILAILGFLVTSISPPGGMLMIGFGIGWASAGLAIAFI